MKIVVAGPVNDLGYGIVTANVVHALTQVGVKVYYRPWPPEPGGLTQESLWAFNGAVCESVSNAYDRWNKYKPEALPHLQIYHEWCLGGPWKGPTIGMPFFETQPIRRDAVKPLRACHKVIVTSVWAAQVLRDSGVPADVVRYVGVDSQVFRSKPMRSASRFVYLHVGKYEVRKGIDVLIQAFGRVAKQYKDADLWLAVDNPFVPCWYGELVKRISDAGLGRYKQQRVFQLHRRPRHSEVADVYNQVNAVVQPSRGEGFGCPALEAISCGVPTAMTWNTGQEYGRHLGTVEILSGDLEPAFDGVFFDGTRQWRDVKADDVYTAMVRLREDPPVVNREALADYTWLAGAERLKAYLEDL